MRQQLLISLIIACLAPLAHAEGKSAKAPAKSGRQKVISNEARSKAGQKTAIDFDEAGIDGQRRTPAGVAISKKNPDQEYDLINLRLRWHPEMVQSTTNLETGRSR